MISLLENPTRCVSLAREGFLNVGDLVEEAIGPDRMKEMRADHIPSILVSRFTVAPQSESRFSELCETLEVEDFAEYVGKVPRKFYSPNPTTYHLRAVSPEKNQPMWEFRRSLQRMPTFAGETNAWDVLAFLSEYGRIARKVLGAYPDIIFFGDAGSFHISFVGSLTLQSGKFRLNRMPVSRLAVSASLQYIVLERIG